MDRQLDSIVLLRSMFQNAGQLTITAVWQVAAEGQGPSQPGRGQAKPQMMGEAAAVPRPADDHIVPYRVLNVAGSRPYSSGRYASAVPAWSEGHQANGTEADLTLHGQQHKQKEVQHVPTQLVQRQAQHGQLHGPHAQYAQQAQQLEGVVAGGLPQGVTFQAPPGATVSGEDAPPLSAPVQVRECSLTSLHAIGAARLRRTPTTAV